MKETKLNTTHTGRAASAMQSASVGRIMPGYGAPVNPLSAIKKAERMIEHPFGSTAMPKQSLQYNHTYPIYVEIFWMGLKTMVKDNTLAGISIHYINYNASTAGFCCGLALVSPIENKVRETIKNTVKMKIKQNSHLQSWAENANDFIKEVCLELAKYDKKKALEILEGKIEALKLDRRSQSAKNQKQIDACISNMRKIAKTLKPEKGPKGGRSGYHEVANGYRGHMAF